MPEKEKKGFNLKALFVTDEPEQPAAAVAPQISAPVAPVTRPIVALPSAVDAAMLERLLSQLASEAPTGYVDFVSSLQTLSDTLPTEDLLYKTALKLSGKRGHDAAMLKLDYEKVLRQLEEQGRQFAADADKQVQAKVGARQAEVARLQQEIARVQAELEAFRAKLQTETEAIAADTAKIEDAKAKFSGAYQAAHTQIETQQSKLSLYGKV